MSAPRPATQTAWRTCEHKQCAYAVSEPFADCFVSIRPLFTSAVILGNMAMLKKEGLGGMNGFAASILALRLAYTAVYLTHKTQGPTAVRSALWAASMGLCLRIIFKAAKALGSAKVGL